MAKLGIRREDRMGGILSDMARDRKKPKPKPKEKPKEATPGYKKGGYVTRKKKAVRKKR